MSDFDSVLERLVADPAFQAALAADPDRALAGYQLSADERELLNAQLTGDAGLDSGVEERTSKAGIFGMLTPLAEAVGLGQSMPRGGEAGFGQSGGGGSSQAAYSEAGAWQPVPDDSGVGQFRQAAEGALGDYHPNLDVDGDGKWDEYAVVARPDGGVDLVADLDHDGRADFIGHDDDRDGLIDSAQYDKDHDGRFETRLADHNGDGWLDSGTDQPGPST